VNPVAARLTPPLKPTTSSRYSEKNFARAGGISRFERMAPANRPKKNSRMAGSIRLENRLESMAWGSPGQVHAAQRVRRRTLRGL
jgi:hypothetical protein